MTLHKVYWYEGTTTHEAVVGDIDSLFSLLWLLDKSEEVAQWNADSVEGSYVWAVKSNWKKWKSWSEWEY